MPEGWEEYFIRFRSQLGYELNALQNCECDPLDCTNFVKRIYELWSPLRIKLLCIWLDGRCIINMRLCVKCRGLSSPAVKSYLDIIWFVYHANLQQQIRLYRLIIIWIDLSHNATVKHIHSLDLWTLNLESLWYFNDNYFTKITTKQKL